MRGFSEVNYDDEKGKSVFYCALFSGQCLLIAWIFNNILILKYITYFIHTADFI